MHYRQARPSLEWMMRLVRIYIARRRSWWASSLGASSLTWVRLTDVCIYSTTCKSVSMVKSKSSTAHRVRMAGQDYCEVGFNLKLVLGRWGLKCAQRISPSCLVFVVVFGPLGRKHRLEDLVSPWAPCPTSSTYNADVRTPYCSSNGCLTCELPASLDDIISGAENLKLADDPSCLGMPVGGGELSPHPS